MSFSWNDPNSFYPMDIVNLYDESDPMHELLENIDFPDGFLVVGTHSTEDNFSKKIYISNLNVNMTVETSEISDAVFKSGLWDGMDPILLIACNAGVWGTSSPAQHLADSLGTKVLAAAGYVYLTPNGEYYASETEAESKDDPNFDITREPDCWFWFYPQGY